MKKNDNAAIGRAPYYQDDRITLYHGNCHDVLPMLTGDAIVTDPPYGIGWSRATWDDSQEVYQEMITWLVDQGNRIGGWCFVFQSMPNVGHFHEWFPKGWRIFAACKNWVQIRPTAVIHSWDPVVFWNGGQEKKWKNATINRDYYVANVSGMLRESPEHPTPKPLSTMQYIVKLACPVGGIVIDPFAGSGTTLLAAKNTGRHAIGIEIEERYCDVSARRLSQVHIPFRDEADAGVQVEIQSQDVTQVETPDGVLNEQES